MRPIVGPAAGLTPVNFGPPIGDHALLAGTTADAGRSPKLPPDQADEFVKHRCLIDLRCTTEVPAVDLP
jgi:hypothetical protein